MWDSRQGIRGSRLNFEGDRWKLVSAMRIKKKKWRKVARNGDLFVNCLTCLVSMRAELGNGISVDFEGRRR
jgi:hypothetical protein